MKVQKVRVLVLVVSAVLFLMPFQWLVLGTVGPLAVKPVHLPLLFLVVTSPVLIPRTEWRRVFSSRAALFIYATLVLWGWTVASVAWAEDGGRAFVNVAKNGMLIVFFLVVTAAAATIARKGKVSRVFVLGCMGGTFAYLSYNLLLFGILGFNYLKEYSLAVVNLDIVRLRFWFSHNLFNCFLDGSCRSFAGDDLEFVASSLKNTLFAAMVTYVATMMSIQSCRLKKFERLLVFSALILCLFFVFTSLSRSNMIALAVVLLFGSSIGVSRTTAGRGMLTRLVGFGGFAIAALVLMVISDLPIRLMEVIALRMGDTASDPRIEMFANALDAVAGAPIIGYGEGKRVLDGAGVAYPVHNLFLASLLEQGAIGLFLAITWYAILGKLVVAIYLAPSSLVEPIGTKWIALIPVVAMIRSLVGAGGDLTLIEWVSLAVCLGTLAPYGAPSARAAESTLARKK